MTSSWRWATVTQAAPLRVRLDGSTAALPVTPDTLVTGLIVGDRVWCQIEGRALVVYGAAAGGSTGWIDIPFTNGWTHYLSGNGIYGRAQYRRNQGNVELRGLAAGGTAAQIGALPVGFRPPFTRIFTTLSNNALCRVDVTASGNITGMAGLTENWVALDGIFFSLD